MSTTIATGLAGSSAPAVIAPKADSRLVEFMAAAHDRPLFISAPRRLGRSSLALDYARRHHRMEDVLWTDCSSESFAEAVTTGALFEQLHRLGTNSLGGFKLVVFDDLPALAELAASLLSDQIDLLIERGVGVIVITTPEQDCLERHQSDRLLLSSEMLIAGQRWSHSRLADVLDCFLNGSAPTALRSLSALMLLMRQGSVEELRSLGFEVAADTHLLLRQICPLIEVNPEDGSFNASNLPVRELSKPLLALLAQAAASFDDELFDKTRRSFQRLTCMAIYLVEQGQRDQSQLLLELAGMLLTTEAKVQPAQIVCEPDSSPAGLYDGYQHFEFLDPFDSLVELGGTGVRSLVTHYPSHPTPTFSQSAPAPLTLRLFGEFEVSMSGQRLDGKELRRSRVRTLLMHLALSLGRGVARDLLLERIWPEKDYLHAKDNFYVTWAKLSRVLAGGSKRCPYLQNSHGLCRLDDSLASTDVHEFEQLSKSVLFRRGNAQQRIEAIYRMEQLYRGDILSGCNADPFIQSAQLRYRDILVDVMLEASALFSEQGNDVNALWFARKAYDTDAGREDVYRVLMAMQDRAGQRTSALQTYFDCKRYLSEELGIMPSLKTRELYQELILDNR